MLKLQTLKGFRDFLPHEAKKRQYVISILKQVFELYGFEPLETPALEYEELLTGKYGDEGDKLMYRFEDKGKRKVAMRYDQTVPLARVVAQYQNELPLPFKRYQIQNVWRADNTQRGRFREFIMCDADTVGTTSIAADAEVIAVTAKVLQTLGFKNLKILINDRHVFEDLSLKAIAILDKLKKIGEDGIIEELVASNTSKNADDAKNLLQSILSRQPTEYLTKVFCLLEDVDIEKNYFIFSPTLARGLDYYTSLIFEIEIPQYPVGSVCGGGRYDNLIGMFANKQIPAVGFAFGFDRIIDAMNELHLFPADFQEATTKVLVTVFNEQLAEQSLQVSSQLRLNEINTEIYLDANTKFEKQLKYADQKNIRFAVIIGPEEVEKECLKLKDLKTGEQKHLRLDELILFLHTYT